MKKIMNHLTKFTVDHKRFEIQKELLTRQLRNFKAEQPHTHAMYYVTVLMDNVIWTKEELALALDGVGKCSTVGSPSHTSVFDTILYGYRLL